MLAEAAWAVVGHDRLDLLVNHEATGTTPRPTDWRVMAATADIVGQLPSAAAALLAIDLDVDVLTGTPGRYAGLGDGDLAIEIEP